MKKVKLADGRMIQLPSGMSDSAAQRVIKSLIGKIGELKAHDREKEIILINTEFPPFSSVPEPKDYSELFEQFIKLDEDNKNKMLTEVRSLNESIAYLGAKIEKHASVLSKAIDTQSEVLAELVNAYREPKKIIRDDNGRPEGIE